MVECGGFENRYPDFFGIVSSNLTLSALNNRVLVVQLDRASGSEPEDRGFDSLRGHFENKYMKLLFSAGGVMIKDQKVLLCQHSQHHGWGFPKGLIDEKETKEETALREVKEETGVDGKIIRALNPVTYWYVAEEEKVRKTVYYFIMEYVGGDIAKHDHEMEKVEWLSKEKVEERLTYKSDKIVWNEVKNLI